MAKDVSKRRTTARKAAPRRRRTQEERRTETRRRLLDAAIALLLESGYSRFRIADAAKLAGVSRGGQTHHFATKNELIEAAIERVFEEEVARAKQRAEESRADATQSMRASAAHIDEFLKSDQYKVSLNMLISAVALENFADRIREISVRGRTPIEAAWIDGLVEAGAERQLATEAFWLLWAVQRGLAVQEIIGGDDGGVNDILDFTVALLDEKLAA